jgi:hypothetical protein
MRLKRQKSYLPLEQYVDCLWQTSQRTRQSFDKGLRWMPTCSFAAVAMYSQSKAHCRFYGKRIVKCDTKVTQPKIVFHLLKLNVALFI